MGGDKDPFLESLYDAFYRRLKGNSEKHVTIFELLLKGHKTTVKKALSESAQSPGLSGVSDSRLEEMVKRNLIRESDETGKYAITAFGIMEIEEEMGLSTKDGFLRAIDTTFLNTFDSLKPLSDKEKVVLFTMLAIRAFSLDSAISLAKSGELATYWNSFFVASANLLLQCGAIADLPRVLRDPKYSSAASELLRRAQDLPSKTRGLYKFSRSHEYYLDIVKDGMTNVEGVSYLMKRIFDQQTYAVNFPVIKQFMSDSISEFGHKLYSSPEVVIRASDFQRHLDRLVLDLLSSSPLAWQS